jgi:hypothetical protein
VVAGSIACCVGVLVFVALPVSTNKESISFFGLVLTRVPTGPAEVQSASPRDVLEEVRPKIL